MSRLSDHNFIPRPWSRRVRDNDFPVRRSVRPGFDRLRAVQTGVAINGTTIGGVLFQFHDRRESLRRRVSSTPDLEIPTTSRSANVEGNTLGVLKLTFPSLETRFGFGYAIAVIAPPRLQTQPASSLFDAGNVSVGALSYNGAADPIFAGGFADYGSTIPFQKRTSHLQQCRRCPFRLRQREI
jgi:hypothetical protein